MTEQVTTPTNTDKVSIKSILGVITAAASISLLVGGYTTNLARVAILETQNVQLQEQNRGILVANNKLTSDINTLRINQAVILQRLNILESSIRLTGNGFGTNKPDKEFNLSARTVITDVSTTTSDSSKTN